MIRLVAVDIDGTITSLDRKLYLPAVEAVRKLEESGIPVVISTGVLPGSSDPEVAAIG